jgi:hypothetical protein
MVLGMLLEGQDFDERNSELHGKQQHGEIPHASHDELTRYCEHNVPVNFCFAWVEKFH